MEQSIFREDSWRSNRHFLNPSKWKEYELHVCGLGFLNKINLFKDYFEKFTPIDPIEEQSLVNLNKKTTLHIIRKDLILSEKKLLDTYNFKLIKTWGTLILNLEKEIKLDENTLKNIRKGEKRLEFFQVINLEDLTQYYTLFKDSRKKIKFKTTSFKEYEKIFSLNGYKIFVVRDKESKNIVAGLGTISNHIYLLEVNAARDDKYFFANDFLKWKIINYCKENNLKYYDFAGVNPVPKQNSKDLNLRKFKEKWGGEFYFEFIFKR